MDIYEYKTVTFGTRESASSFPDSIERELNNLGKDRWELVSMISNPQLGSTKYALLGVSISTFAVLKRKQQENANGGNL